MARGKRERTVSAEPVEGPWALPVGWRWVPLGSLGQFLNGAAFKPGDWGEAGIPIIRIQNLNNPEKVMNRTTRLVDESLRVIAGDILVSWSATLDAFIWRGEDAWLNQHIFRVLPNSELVEHRYMFYLLKNEIENLKKSEHLHGSTMMHINRGPFLAHPVPLPPIATQRRIVARIDELFAEVEDGEAALERARADLGVWRKALLKAAVTGELTADWRANNPPTETGAELLARILAERRARWQAEPRNKGKRYVEPAGPDMAGLPELPDGWVWTTAGVAGDVRQGRQRAPVHHTGENMRPYLRVANVRENRLDLRDVKWMNFTPEEFNVYALRTGDVLLNEGQSPELLGRPALYCGEIEDCCFQNTLLRFRPTPVVDPAFAVVVFRRYMHAMRFVEESRITTNLAHLTLGRFLPVEFPLPPIEEQREIARRFHEAETAWERETLDADFSATLRQSILAAAFRGTLTA